MADSEKKIIRLCSQGKQELLNNNCKTESLVWHKNSVWVTHQECQTQMDGEIKVVYKVLKNFKPDQEKEIWHLVI